MKFGINKYLPNSSMCFDKTKKYYGRLGEKIRKKYSMWDMITWCLLKNLSMNLDES